jgi:asparagine synthetase A
MKHFANCRLLLTMLSTIFDGITGRSRIVELESIIVSANKIRNDEDVLTLQTYSIISGYNEELQNRVEVEQNKFFVLYSYVNAIASAINGTETVIPIELGIEADVALQMLITSAKEQNAQLLATRVRVSKLEDVLLKTKKLDGEP